MTVNLLPGYQIEIRKNEDNFEINNFKLRLFDKTLKILTIFAEPRRLIRRLNCFYSKIPNWKS